MCLTILSRSGVSASDHYLKARGVIISNYISLILCASITLIFVIRWLLNGIIIPSLIAGFLLFLSPIIFNRLSWTTLSRMFLCYVPVGFLWYIFISNLRDINSIEASIYDGLRMFLLSLSFIPYLLFEKDKFLVLFVGVLPTLISIFLFEYLLTWAGVSSHQLGLVSHDYTLMQTRSIITYLIVSASCYAFLYVITQNDKLNQQLMADLKNKSEEIEVQNEELVQSQEKLNELNLHLEDLVVKKTHNIELQNEKLTKYAFSNAHHVRGPIARLLGLIQLSKLETDLDYRWYFDKMEHESNEIDKITKRIARELNSTDPSTEDTNTNHDS
jgi:signal transduction histidine kinase